MKTLIGVGAASAKPAKAIHINNTINRLMIGLEDCRHFDPMRERSVFIRRLYPVASFAVRD